MEGNDLVARLRATEHDFRMHPAGLIRLCLLAADEIEQLRNDRPPEGWSHHRSRGADVYVRKAGGA